MKLVIPEYYERFACKGGMCTDNCCIGWEIDIDPVTLKKYEIADADMRGRLSDGICKDGDSAHFKLDKGRCPFLNKENLCDIIIKLGETSLCDICREHPRYYLALDDTVYSGVGLCCEAAAELILTAKAPPEYVMRDGFDGEFEECDGELRQIVFEAKDRILKKTASSLSVSALLSEAYRIVKEAQMRIDGDFYEEISEAVPSDICGELISFFSAVEYRRAELLHMITGALRGKKRSLGDVAVSYLKNIFVYFIDRYLPQAACDGDIVAKFAIPALSVAVIAAIFAEEESLTLARAVDISKSYSSEIEYNEENIALIEESARCGLLHNALVLISEYS
ncbi:MAG: flagellin lysine-N-methylase [Clostridia bacterium]|nr:flagellin lysine-N-methylase [Clostridia bacterium]